MMRALFWIALAVLVFFVVRSKLRALDRARQGEPDKPALREEEPMANCDHCHTYFPASESVHAHGKVFCSSAHARLSSD